MPLTSAARSDDESVLHRIAAAAVLLGVTAGCAAPRPAGQGMCTLRGGASGVTFLFPKVAVHRLPIHARSCVQNICETDLVTATSVPVANVEDSHLTSAHPARVRLTLRDGRGRLLFNGSRRVAIQRFTPNGPRCDRPPWWRALLRTSGRSRLVSLPVDARMSLATYGPSP